MTGRSPTASATMDDRSPYDVALAALRTIARHSDLADEEAVRDRIMREIRPQSYEYLTTIARTKHSVFYHQLQELYEFGRGLVSPEVRDEFCFLVGGEFAKTLLAENLHPLQQVALARDADFQKAIVEIIHLYATRYTGDKYVLSARFDQDHIHLSAAYRSPEVVSRYLQEYGLEAEPCFRNSAMVIAGAIEHFASHLTEGYDPRRFELELDGLSATMHVPVRVSDRFNYRTLIQTFSGHILELEKRQSTTFEDGILRDDLILGSTLMRQQWERIRRASQTDELILLRGESGTGKSLMASKIHELSARHDKPFVEVALTSDVGSENMVQSDLFGHEKGAFTGADRQKQGLFYLAHGGTIFLDEIGDASPEVQAKLLRVLETSRFRRLGGVDDISVDVRVIAATNRDLERMVEEGAFRQDLYFRLNVIALRMPPLREHPEDIPALVHFLLARAQGTGSRTGVHVSDELIHELERYSWPGNIRELDHALRHAIALAEGTRIRLEDLPPGVVAGVRGSGGASDGRTRVGSVASPGRLASSAEAVKGVIDEEALRRKVRSCNPVSVGLADQKADIVAHIEHAKRAYLRVLIDELDGDLSLIAQFWDRGSDKTLRNQIRAYGLMERLGVARERRKAKR